MRVIVQPLLNELISTAIAIPKAKEVTVGTALKVELVRLSAYRKCIVGKRHHLSFPSQMTLAPSGASHPG